MNKKSTPAFPCLYRKSEGSASKLWQDTQRRAMIWDMEGTSELICQTPEWTTIRKFKESQCFRLLNEENFSFNLSLFLPCLSLSPPSLSDHTSLSLSAEAGFVSSFILLISTHTTCFSCMDHYTFRFSPLKHTVLHYRNHSVFLVKGDRSDNFIYKQKLLWKSAFPPFQDLCSLSYLAFGIDEILALDCRKSTVNFKMKHVTTGSVFFCGNWTTWVNFFRPTVFSSLHRQIQIPLHKIITFFFSIRHLNHMNQWKFNS